MTQYQTALTDLPTYISELRQMQEEENQAFKSIAIQEEEYQIDEKNLKKLYILGKGSFGEVAVYLDKINGKRYARKVFSKFKDFDDEKNVMMKLQQVMGNDLDIIAAKLEKYDIQQQSIFYNCGECSLQELIEIRAQNKVYWWDRQQELVYILKEIFGMFKIMFQKQVYHTDLKPANIVLIKKTKNQLNRSLLQLKLIDFGGVCYDWREIIRAYTPEYFINIFENPPYNSELIRIKAELYTLGRTLMRVMLSSIAAKEKIRIDILFNNNKEYIEEAFSKLKVYYRQEIVEIVQNLISQGDPIIIEQKLDKLSQETIEDKERLIRKMIDQKTQNELIQITGNNLEKEVSECITNGIYDRGLQVLDNISDKIFQNLELCNLKIECLNKIGYNQQAFEFIKQCQKLVNFDSEKVNKWQLFKFQLYQCWELPIEQGRYNLISEIKQQIKEHFGPESREMAQALFFQGWLNGADGDNNPQYYIQAVENLQQSLAIYEKLQSSLLTNEMAEVYSYLIQSYDLLNQSGSTVQKALNNLESIRKKMNGEKSVQYGEVLLKFGIFAGKSENNYSKGLNYIDQCLSIFESTIGENNYNYINALNWKADFHQHFQNYNIATISREKALLLAYQVSGKDGFAYTSLKDGQIWELYNRGYNVLFRIYNSFVLVGEDHLKFEDYQLALDYMNVALDLLESNCNKSRFQLLDKQVLQTRIRYRILFINQLIQINQQLELSEQVQMLQFLYQFIPKQYYQDRASIIIKYSQSFYKQATNDEDQLKAIRSLETFLLEMQYSIYQNTASSLQNLYNIKQDNNIQYLIFQITIEISNLCILDKDNIENINNAEIMLQKAIQISTSASQRSEAQAKFLKLLDIKLQYHLSRENLKQSKYTIDQQLSIMKDQIGENSVRFITILLEIGKLFEQWHLFNDAFYKFQYAKKLMSTHQNQDRIPLVDESIKHNHIHKKNELISKMKTIKTQNFFNQTQNTFKLNYFEDSNIFKYVEDQVKTVKKMNSQKSCIKFKK